jgi:ABC-type antimicrobial peptide transport system permease subunit
VTVRLPSLAQAEENLRIAMETLRGAKLRSGLTILGVVIGVATVMTMASLVEGLRRQIISTVEVAGPTTFYVLKAYSSTPVNPQNPPAWIRIRPDLRDAEADRIRRLPEVAYAGIWGQTLARVAYRGERTQPVGLFGADAGFTEIQGGTLAEGRWFTRAEVLSGASVVVLQEAIARRLFGRAQPLGATVLVGGRPMEVVGLYLPPENIFAPQGAETGAIIPYRLLDAQFEFDKTNAQWIPVKPRAGVTVAQAQEAVTIAMRELRRDDGLVVPLSGAEYRLLCVFVAHPQVVLSRERLTELAHGRELQPFERSIDIQVGRLRQRLQDAGDAKLLKTVRSGGYVLAADVEPGLAGG